MSKTVKYEVDLANLPPLTAVQKAELAALAAMPDSQVDHSDIPPLAEEILEGLGPGPVLPARSGDLSASQGAFAASRPADPYASVPCLKNHRFSRPDS